MGSMVRDDLLLLDVVIDRVGVYMCERLCALTLEIFSLFRSGPRVQDPGCEGKWREEV